MKKKTKKMLKMIFFGTLTLIGLWGTIGTLTEKNYGQGSLPDNNELEVE